jgi:type VI secretion system protein ImpE
MDADPRFGPTLEVVVEGHYRWLPMSAVRELRAEPPEAMRDLVWQPATLSLANGSELKVFIPARYPGAETEADDRLRLGHATEWRERAHGQAWGAGQRLFATDSDDIAFLEVRRLRFDETSEMA